MTYVSAGIPFCLGLVTLGIGLYMIFQRWSHGTELSNIWGYPKYWVSSIFVFVGLSIVLFVVFFAYPAMLEVEEDKQKCVDIGGTYLDHECWTVKVDLGD